MRGPLPDKSVFKMTGLRLEKELYKTTHSTSPVQFSVCLARGATSFKAHKKDPHKYYEHVVTTSRNLVYGKRSNVGIEEKIVSSI